MTRIFTRVESFLCSRRGEAYCEECIQRELGLSGRKHLHETMEMLGFDRAQRFLRTPHPLLWVH